MASDDAIHSITYDPEKQELRLAFADGRQAIHPGVPSAIHAALAAAPEPMRFYQANIREQFPKA